MFLLPVTETEILNVNNDMKHSNSSGVDRITCKMLKVINRHILAPLTFLFNFVFSQGSFPECLIIVFDSTNSKKGDPHELSNNVTLNFF